MSKRGIGAIAVLNEAGAVARRVAAPWVGVLWLTALPARLLQVRFFYEAFRLGGEASHYGTYLTGLAWSACAASVPALWGRAVYARACLLARNDRPPAGASVFRVPLAALLSYLYAAVLFEAAGWALAWTLVALPVTWLFAGLAAATAHRNGRPGLVRPLREVFRAAAEIKPLLVLLFVFAAALGIAWINVYVAFLGGLWLAGGVGGWDLSAWEHLLRPQLFWPAESLVRWLMFAGATLAVEPFWLAALVVHADRMQAHETGDDLRQAFADARREAAA